MKTLKRMGFGLALILGGNAMLDAPDKTRERLDAAATLAEHAESKAAPVIAGGIRATKAAASETGLGNVLSAPSSTTPTSVAAVEEVGG